MSGSAGRKIRLDEEMIADGEIRDLSDRQCPRAAGHFDFERRAGKVERSRSRARGPQPEQRRDYHRAQCGKSETHADMSVPGYTLSSFLLRTVAHLRFFSRDCARRRVSRWPCAP